MNFKPITILLIAFTVILVFTGCQSVKPGPYKPYKGIDPITYSSRRDLKFETDGSIFFSPLEADFMNLKVVPDTQGRVYAYKQDSNPSYYIFKEGLIIDKIIDAGSKKLTPHIEAGFSRAVEIQSVLSGNIAQIKAFPFNYHYYLTVDDAVLCKDKMRLRSTVEDTKIWKNDKLVGDYINGRYAASKARGKTLFLRDTFSKAASECSFTMDMYGNMADITNNDSLQFPEMEVGHTYLGIILPEQEIKTGYSWKIMSSEIPQTAGMRIDTESGFEYEVTYTYIGLTEIGKSKFGVFSVKFDKTVNNIEGLYVSWHGREVEMSFPKLQLTGNGLIYFSLSESKPVYSNILMTIESPFSMMVDLDGTARRENGTMTVKASSVMVLSDLSGNRRE